MRRRAPVREGAPRGGRRAGRDHRRLSRGGRVIGLYRPGTSALHRAPAGAKVAALAVLAVAATLLVRTPLAGAAALAATLVAFAAGALGVAAWAAQVWAMRWLVVLVAGSQWIFLGPAEAAAGTARVVTVLLLAAVVTMTTPTSEMIDALERALAPLARVGVDPWRVAFVVQLTIAVVPVVGSLWHRVAEARRARGVRLGPRAVVTLLVLALRYADEVGDALTARGIAPAARR
ncbi:energy-coupling factor transporter transmembrane protein EcfT [Microbacterium sp. CBS5P-1]|nr:energy-coupling factor transporter transmembrane protein EcfT [Microbacterium excoecariae]